MLSRKLPDFSGVPYVVCPNCLAAFVATALRAPCRVKCSICNHTFLGKPDELYQPWVPQKQETDLKKNEIRCKHFGECPGCELKERVDAPPIAKKVEEFLREIGLQSRFNVQFSSATHWRSFAKLAVRDEDGHIKMGLFQSGTHHIISVEECAVHAPEINNAARAIMAAFKELGVTGYSEHNGSGLCKYVLFAVQRETRLVQVTFVWNKKSWKDAIPLVRHLSSLLWRLHGAFLFHSIWFNWNTSSSNVIIAPDIAKFYRMQGQKEFVDKIMGLDTHFAPYAFRQANLDAFENLLLPEFLRYVPERSSVAEFCAGVGVIGLTALRHKKLRRLSASEINECAQDLFWKSLYATPRPRGQKKPEIKFLVGSDDETVDMAYEDVDIIIVDPPRAGLSEAFIEKIRNPPRSSSLKRFIYVSCGFDAFRRDARSLVKGDWALLAAHGFVLFPGVNHVEILAVFDRRHQRTKSSSSRSKGTAKTQAVPRNLPGLSAKRPR